LKKNNKNHKKLNSIKKREIKRVSKMINNLNFNFMEKRKKIQVMEKSSGRTDKNMNKTKPPLIIEQP
jgi:hypothetical protein